MGVLRSSERELYIKHKITFGVIGTLAKRNSGLTASKVNYFYWTQPQKNILCDDIVQKLTFYCTDIYREPLVQQKYYETIIDNWKESLPLKCVPKSKIETSKHSKNGI